MNARWFAQLSWPALRHQAGRQLLALLAIVLGVALAYAVHLLNGTALAEFGSAAASLNGKPDLVLRARAGALGEEVYAEIARRPGVQIAAPVLEGMAQAADAQGQRFNLRVLGLDALQAAPLSPQLLPHGQDLQQLLDPQRLFLNEAALQRLPQPRPERLTLRVAGREGPLSTTQTLGGTLDAAGAPLAVLDIAGAQLLLGRLGQLDRIDLRLRPGLSPTQWLAEAKLPAGLVAAPPPDEGERLQELSRAYRVNLGVLSLMALFTGSFLVFAVLSLSVAQRLPQWALLGVLGMSARERGALVLAEGLLLGLIGSLLGLLLGWWLAALALQRLGSDLGLGLIQGLRPQLRFAVEQLPAAAVFGLLGLVVSALAAGAPALAVRRMPVAQVLKGLGGALHGALPAWLGPALLLAGLALALLPPLAGVPLAAYLAMLAMLLGGIACVPALLRGAVAMLARLPDSATLLLLRERALDQAGEALRALAGVLVSLSLSVAMLVMVGSFRDSLDQWLTRMLPADLYIRSALRLAPGQAAPLPPAYVAAVRHSALAERIAVQRSANVLIEGAPQPVTALAREIEDEGQLPLAGALAEGQGLPLYVNEALRDALRLAPGQRLTLRLEAGAGPQPAFVRGVWRDYARQSGALILPLAAYRQWSGDATVSELMVWLRPGTDAQAAAAQLRALAAEPQDLELAAAGELRGISLRIFDRSFAVTHWLQAVALAIGLFGIAASQSAQVLARRREFGLLLHLGLTRAGVLRLLALEAALLCGIGALAGLALGLALSAVLVFVVNPQSFHWSMDLSLPWPRLTGLLAATFTAGVLAALIAGRRAASGDAVQAVKEDW
ncbi:ABC transporter permease [Roseateles violae]|uniref:ABC transporter permease n=1 Tax=Roseateles violae TaxID=3058042 RepID=A0ABT8DU77_9BURK|nr:ABC transporter permease [Pelomonas sp. PFR6]MDN3920608.1 ABC transporter permease [Pelomonas sp. PFR6]